MDYFDIDQILMEEQKVPCSPVVDIVKLGDLAGADTPYLQRNVRIEIPLWIISNIRAKTKGAIFDLRAPLFLNASHLEMLEADADVINIEAWCPYFYAFAIAFLHLQPDTAVGEAIIKSFGDRYKGILDLAHASLQRDVSERTRNLAHTELVLFSSCAADERYYTVWQARKSYKIRAWKGVKRSSHSTMAFLAATTTTPREEATTGASDARNSSDSTANSSSNEKSSSRSNRASASRRRDSANPTKRSKRGGRG